MENLEILISVVGTAIGLFITTITFIVKFIKSVKERVKEKGVMSLINFAPEVIQFAETMINYSGEEKKEFVMTKLNQFAIENKIEFDKNRISLEVEKLVSLSNTVNIKKKEIQ